MPVAIAIFLTTFISQLLIPWDKWPFWLFVAVFLLEIALIIGMVANLQINYGLPVLSLR